MKKVTLTYADFNGDTVTNDFYFNLTKAEYTKFLAKNVPIGENGEPEDLKAYTESLIAKKDYGKLIDLVEAIIKLSYGEKRDNRFVKQENGLLLGESFACSDAFSVLFDKMASDEAFLQGFVQGIIPYKKPAASPAV